MDFTTIERAGVTQEQFAELLGVSRITVNTWVRGHRFPHHNVRTKVRVALNMLEGAVERGELPIKLDAKAATREWLRDIAATVATAKV